MAANAVEDAAVGNEWIHIAGKGGNKKKLGRRRAGTQPPAAGPASHFRPNPTPTLSAADIQAEHAKLVAKWRAGQCHRRLRHLVHSNAASHARVRRAICLGLGAFEPDDGSWVARRQSHIQLAAFLAIVDAIEQATAGDDKIACFYQEPRFAQPDKDFLASLGGHVVESPASYALVDSATLVFGVHLYRDIWAAVLDKRLPAVFVGTGWDVWDGTAGASESPDFGRIREMDGSAAFDRLAFPQDDDDPAVFSSTCVYWRQLDDDMEGTADLATLPAPHDLEARNEAHDKTIQVP